MIGPVLLKLFLLHFVPSLLFFYLKVLVIKALMHVTSPWTNCTRVLIYFRLESCRYFLRLEMKIYFRFLLQTLIVPRKKILNLLFALRRIFSAFFNFLFWLYLIKRLSLVTHLLYNFFWFFANLWNFSLVLLRFNIKN